MSEGPDRYSEARRSIRNMVDDPVTKLLVSSSHLTIPQLETLLANSISYEKTVKKEHRRLFRPSKSQISRGSYNRTLIQAQNNVIHAIYTILLLGYVGLFDDASLQPFLELSDNLQSYITERKDASQTVEVFTELKGRLTETVSALARRQSFKDIL
ncbi:MAG TPA: hypothetical protein VLV31_00115 [Candidatus Acidoferrales bacterium]|nr:hypothetical protein [Candidatus Acidoferrales bacterium]